MEPSPQEVATAKAWEELCIAVTRFRKAINVPEFDGLDGRERMVIWTNVLKRAVNHNETIFEIIDATKEAA